METPTRINKMWSTNMLAHSPHLGLIIQEYNRRLMKDGKVNRLRFFREVILPLVPEYNQGSWYAFLRRYSTPKGLVVAGVPTVTDTIPDTPESKSLVENLLTTAKAESDGLQIAANLGKKALEDFYKNYDTMTPSERLKLADMLFKTMKSRDSRIHAVGKIREDNREQEKFERAFDGAAFEQ